MPLSADDITRAFEALSEELARRGHRGRMVVTGDAALVLLFPERAGTDVVEAYVARPEPAEMRNAAEAVAERLQLPKDWFNENAEGYVVGATLGAVLFESPHLEVRAPTMVQLLAMKLVAWRDATDRSDAMLLLGEFESSAAEIWNGVRMFVPEDRLEQVFDAFEELWKTVHRPS